MLVFEMLPLTFVSPPEVFERSASVRKKLLMTKKILIAEDDADIRFILALVLTNAGYNVEELPTGARIVEGMNRWPDLFILDKAMPTIDGLALCKFLKLKKETKDIPIIMMSSYHRVKTKAHEVGVDDFIEKPFDLEKLLHLVDKHINSHHTRVPSKLRPLMSPTKVKLHSPK